MTGLVHAHSGLRYLILAGFLWVIFNFIGKRNEAFDGGIKKAFLITMIFLHVQLIIGLVLYFKSAKSAMIFEDFGMAMGNSLTRFYGMEHMVGMLIGIALATVGYSKAKRMSDGVLAHAKAFKLYAIAFVIIFVSIPWPFLREFGTWF
ncbi:cytochrome B [Luteibaculum oceani]|uniref:Cytochrome B n=1 Tax=Luteibaculum oceani TaxID=1294296 RepID=A0A5C6UZU8_9FLAO|nr:cytochrome B [Luteibaculum oceani]TXC78963.1 cytochrome B [Luteibaculum oceani]